LSLLFTVYESRFTIYESRFTGFRPLPFTVYCSPLTHFFFTIHFSRTNRTFPPTIVMTGFTSLSFSGGVL
jgi:hypothetical protein